MDQNTISSLLDAITAFGKEEWDAGAQNTPAASFHGRATVARAVAASLRTEAGKVGGTAAAEIKALGEGFAAIAREGELAEAAELEARAASLKREAFLVGFDGANQNISEGESHLLLERPRGLDCEAEALRRRAAALRARP